MTWFIIGSNDGIVGRDEFRNDAYMSELQKFSYGQTYRFLESVNPCKGFNDGTSYLKSDGNIGWSSCEVSIPEIPPETFEVGTPNNPYVFSITGDAKFMLFLKDNIMRFGNKLDILLEKLGYQVVIIGWDVGVPIGYGKQESFDVAFIKKGTAPIALTLVLLIGIVATALVFIAYNVRFSIKNYMDGKILIAREDTNKAYYDGLKAVIESPFTSEEEKNDAANALGSPPPLPPLKPPLTNGTGSGIFTGISLAAIIGLGFLAFLALRKKS